MDRAYDIFQKTIVFANSIKKTRNRKRYKCPCCNEEVIHAFSDKITSYFKHLNGNNNADCENYFKQEIVSNINQHPTKNKNERAEFYFDNNRKMFFLGIRFNDKILNYYEQNGASLELLTSKNERAISPFKIDNQNFFQNILTMIPIELFSFSYSFKTYSNLTWKNEVEECEVFKANGNPTFYKILGNDDINCKAKLVNKDILYTNIPYIAIFHNHSLIQQNSNLSEDIGIKDTFTFETLGRTFIGKHLIVKNKTAKTVALLSSWGFNLESSETLTLLWPPASVVNDVFLINFDYAYIHSSLKFPSEIEYVMNSVSKHSFSKPRKYISHKNIEFRIAINKRSPINLINFPVSERFENVYKVQDNKQHFLFNRSGVKQIREGQSVSLTPASIIKCYRYGYLESCIYPMIQADLTGEQLLNDILTHYKRTEVYNENVFDSLELSETALKYIINCKTTGLINSAVMNFIKEDRL